MRHIVFIGSHLGYPMDRTPLGGGAMVGLQLVRHWSRAAAEDGFHLTVIGSGSHAPCRDADYLQLPAQTGADASSPDLVRLSELGYARFCREFEAATTAYLLDGRRGLDPERTVVVVNDISESPDLDRLAEAGFRLLSIWHVDVVEFFNRIYLHNVVSPERWTRAFCALERMGVSRLLPDILRLVFQKQRQAVERSDLLILPSRQMADTILRCYRGLFPGAPSGEGGPPAGRSLPLPERTSVVPWGGWREDVSEEAAAVEASRLRAHYQLRPDSRVILTMSRISPEKGIHILLEALRLLEASARFRAVDVCLFVCGETAFMRGESYGRKVRAAAERLRRFRVFFPGYQSAFEKQVYFRLADLFASPSLHESYGLTLVEAMQAGLPVLASDHYGVDEILAPSYGRKVSYRDPARRARGLAAALEELLADPEELRLMGGRARDAAGRMDFAGAADRLLEAAKGLLSRGPDGRHIRRHIRVGKRSEKT